MSERMEPKVIFESRCETDERQINKPWFLLPELEIHLTQQEKDKSISSPLFSLKRRNCYNNYDNKTN